MSTRNRCLGLLILLLAGACPPLWASTDAAGSLPDLTASLVGYACIGIFVLAYALVIGEEWLGLRKSVPVLLAAGLIWVLIGWQMLKLGHSHDTAALVRHSLLEYGELFLFLLVAMTYINTMEERNVFDALHSWLVSRGYSLRTVFWLTGLLAFFISPIADNMTTALVMASVAMAVGHHHPRFVVLACINIVVAANAGGAWSPFGDITTLMVWQKGLLSASQFLALLVPSIVNWLVPAVIMSFAVQREVPPPLATESRLKPGAVMVIALFVGTIAFTVMLHGVMHLPPVIGMMTGFGALKLLGAWLGRNDVRSMQLLDEGGLGLEQQGAAPAPSTPFNIFHQVARAEWDTLLFFYGIILCVGGLGTLGYLAVGSAYLYGELGATTANVLVGIASAIIDNIPVMYAVLTMNPAMSEGQWLLVTLTAGVGGSMLSIGSAAGVAVMGQAHGIYTFFSHLKWTWAIALGYIASIYVHLWLNADALSRAVGQG